MEAAPATEPNPYRGASIVLYDGVCAMCNGIVRFLLRRDRTERFFFAPLQSAFANDALTRHGKNAGDLDTAAVVIDHGLPSERVLLRARAMLWMLEESGGIWRPLAIGLGKLPMPILDAAYGLIVRNRYRFFGRYDSCPLPPPEHRRRFIKT